ncbi:hypothetical protein HWV62_9411 [Athelia sp. TMB]|nr:hypothetical protein HWV62_9411 [Athelia sp. TMB]
MSIPPRARAVAHPYARGPPPAGQSTSHRRRPTPGHSRSSSASAPGLPALTSLRPPLDYAETYEDEIDSVWVDQHAAELNLSPTNSRSAHEFAQLSTAEMLVLLYMQNLSQQQKATAFLDPMKEITSALSRIEGLVRKAWEPSEGQVKLLKELLRHYLIKPVNSYKDLQGFVRDYISKNLEKLKLQIYSKDPLAKRKIDKLLTKEANELKSQFRKSVFDSVRNRTPLHDFAKHMVATYHMPKRPDPIPNIILATLALHRDVARPLASKKSVKGGDTGHWSGVEHRLKSAYEEHGHQRGVSPGWVEWQDSLLNEDAEVFNQADMDPDHELAEHEYGEEDEDDGLNPEYDGEVDLNNMGDMAADA